MLQNSFQCSPDSLLSLSSFSLPTYLSPLIKTPSLPPFFSTKFQPFSIASSQAIQRSNLYLEIRPKMPSDSSSETRRLTKPSNPAAGAPPPEQEHLPCPRCDSTNTKFCYYNNYNFSQPRHFCKSCRRYWTHGGTLRDIPVGGGTRKNAKRSRTATSGTMNMMMNTTIADNLPLPATPVLVPLMGNQGGSSPFGVGGGVDGKGNNPVCGSFTSLLNTQGPGFLALGGFGLGLSSGFDQEMGFGLGRGVWPFPGVGDGGAGVGGGGSGGGAGGMGNTWQFENGENGFVGGDCFSWPDLSISTAGNGLK